MENKYDVYIETGEDTGLWETYFDDVKDHFVAIGNRDYKEEKTEWWEEADKIYDEYTYGELDEKEMKEIETIENNSKNQREVIFEIAKEILKYDVKSATIRGYIQRDWQYVYYETKYENELKYYEALYFGKYDELNFKSENEEDNFYDIITHDDLWKYERGNLKEELEKRSGVKINKVYKEDGYIRTPKWKQVA